MTFYKRFIKVVACIIFMLMIIQTAGCGTLLYPERRYTPSPDRIDPAGRQVDPGIAVLDAILLLPGIIPGLIAFAVDFSTGAIYLPEKAAEPQGTKGKKHGG